MNKKEYFEKMNAFEESLLQQAGREHRAWVVKEFGDKKNEDTEEIDDEISDTVAEDGAYVREELSEKCTIEINLYIRRSIWEKLKMYSHFAGHSCEDFIPEVFAEGLNASVQTKSETDQKLTEMLPVQMKLDMSRSLWESVVDIANDNKIDLVTCIPWLIEIGLEAYGQIPAKEYNQSVLDTLDESVRGQGMESVCCVKELFRSLDDESDCEGEKNDDPAH